MTIREAVDLAGTLRREDYVAQNAWFPGRGKIAASTIDARDLISRSPIPNVSPAKLARASGSVVIKIEDR